MTVHCVAKFLIFLDSIYYNNGNTIIGKLTLDSLCNMLGPRTVARFSSVIRLPLS